MKSFGLVSTLAGSCLIGLNYKEEDLGRDILIKRAIHQWHKVPNETVESSVVEAFRKRLDKHLARILFGIARPISGQLVCLYNSQDHVTYVISRLV